MQNIHLTVEPGGEECLGWARSRERALRQAGSHAGSFRYDMPGGQRVLIRMLGDDSFIHVSGGAWVAYPFNFTLKYSALDVQKLSFDTPTPEDPGPPPVWNPPDPQPFGDTTFSPACPTEIFAPGPSGVCELYGGIATTPAVLSTAGDVGEADYLYSLAQGMLYREAYDAKIAALTTAQRGLIYRATPDPQCPPTPAGATLNHEDFTTQWTAPYNEMDYVILSRDPFTTSESKVCISRWSSRSTWNGTTKNLDSQIVIAKHIAAVSEANDAAHIAYAGPYSQAFAAWSQKNADWQAAQTGIGADPAVCYPHFSAVKAATRAGRLRHASLLRNEILTQGMWSSLVFNAVARPAYIPKERMAEPFVTSAGVWVEPGRYDHISSSRASVDLPSTASCSGIWPAYNYTDSYIDADVSNPDLMVSLKRAYGYSFTGFALTEQRTMTAPSSEPTLASSYKKWIGSPRIKNKPKSVLTPSETEPFEPGPGPDETTLKYDLAFGSSGRARVMYFECEVYENGEWFWAPSNRMIAVSPVIDCVTGYCGWTLAPPDNNPVIHPTERIRAMRMLAAKEYAYKPDDGGDFVLWSEGEDLDITPEQASAFSLDLSAMPFDRVDLPDGVVVMYGVHPWKLPVDPDLSVAFDKSLIGKPAAITTPNTATSASDLSGWIAKSATQVLMAAKKKPPAQ